MRHNACIFGLEIETPPANGEIVQKANRGLSQIFEIFDFPFKGALDKCNIISQFFFFFLNWDFFFFAKEVLA